MHVLGLDQGGDGDSVMVPPVRHRANMANLPAVTPLQLVNVGISWLLVGLKKHGFLEISKFLRSALLPHPCEGQLRWFEQKV